MNKFSISLLCFLFVPSIYAQSVFEKAEAKGTINNKILHEASGLAASVNRPHLLWTHNDSGDEPRLFLLNKSAEIIAQYQLKGARNRDWEDIATGPGPIDNYNYIYVGEIGDNRAIYDTKIIYRLKEPDEDSPTQITDFDTIEFVYPDGKRDAESLLVDPSSKDIYVLSKREDKIGIYLAAYPQSTTDVITLKKLGSIPFHNTTAADISADGEEILLKTYAEIRYWKRNGRTIGDTLLSPSQAVKYTPEPQGESIAFTKDGKGFFTLSEKRNGIEPVLYYFKRSD